MLYKIGDVVVHGREIGKIVEIVNQDQEDYYKIQSFSDPTLSVRTPVSDAKKRLRPVMNRQEAENLIDQMSSIEAIEVETRTAEDAYKKMIASGEHEDVVRLIKTSYLRCAEKTSRGLPRHEKDKMFLRMAENLLYSEFSVALGKSYDETKKYVFDRLSQTA